MNKWTSKSAIGMNLWVLLRRYFDSQFLERPDTENSYYKAISNCVGIVSLVFEMLCTPSDQQIRFFLSSGL